MIHLLNWVIRILLYFIFGNILRFICILIAFILWEIKYINKAEDILDNILKQ